MQKTVETGLFIPTGNHGWIHSVNAPAVEDGSYSRILEIVQNADALGFDFVISPAIWRGRKGPSRHWTHALESVTTTSALLQATDRITVFPPAVLAKMVATQDQIGPGRVGLNLVTGSSYLDLAHVGLWNDELDHDQRYDLADEWVSLAKSLWTEEITDFHGEFYQTMQGTMGPKPSVLPDLVNAGASPRGFRFAAENCKAAVIPVNDDPKTLAVARQGKQIADDLGKPDFKVYGIAGLIPGDTDADAQARLAHFDAGVDLECLEDIAAGYEQNRGAGSLSETSKTLGGRAAGSAVSPGTMVGSYEDLGRRLAALVVEALMLTVPEYIEDVTKIAEITIPVMAEHGVTCQVKQAAAA
jgi:pyrimidine oxygenase